MTSFIRQKATDPLQYDRGEVLWNQEGSELNPIRRLFAEVLEPFLIDIGGKRALDVGCGQGWLCNKIIDCGGSPIGLDPSSKNVEAARTRYPTIVFEQDDLLNYQSEEPFDVIMAIMVFEHLSDMVTSFKAMKSLLKPQGKVVIILGDFDKYTHSRLGCKVEIERIAPGEVATKSDYGQRAGIMYDINRTPERLMAGSRKVGFELVKHLPIMPPIWLLKEQPRYKAQQDKPQFHLMEFTF